MERGAGMAARYLFKAARVVRISRSCFCIPGRSLRNH